jgi:hypothetical protein
MVQRCVINCLSPEGTKQQSPGRESPGSRESSQNSPERATQSASPFQGWFCAIAQFPGLTPWALLLDPFRVPFGHLI